MRPTINGNVNTFHAGEERLANDMQERGRRLRMAMMNRQNAERRVIKAAREEFLRETGITIEDRTK